MVNNVIVESVAGYVPERVITNEDLIDGFLLDKDISGRAIERVTEGIRERCFITEGEYTTAKMAVRAVFRAMEGKDFEIDTLLYVGNTPPKDFRKEDGELRLSHVGPVNIHELVPQTRRLMSELKKDSRFKKTKIYESFGGCAHFSEQMIQAYGAIQREEMNNVVVATSTDISRCLDPADRETAVLFGDGACAALLRRGDDGPRMVHSYEGRDPSPSSDRLLYYELIGDKWYLKMPDGNAVTRKALDVIKECLDEAEAKRYKRSDFGCYILHQANGKILYEVAKRYGIDPNMIHRTLDRYGNTSSASVGITWDDALQQGKIKTGQKVFVCSFGAGFTWNSIVVQY